MQLIKYLSGCVVGCALCAPAQAEQIHTAVAANFTAAMKEIAAQFEQQSPHQVVLSFSSSGKIFAQIKNGAPYQVFLSADQAKPAALEAAGLIAPEQRYTYAVGALALWSATPDFVDQQHTRLSQGAFNKLAFANPKLAPYGSAATQVLDALGLTESTRTKWVQGENIAQTYQFVATGNADLGFVALSQLMDKGQIRSGSAWIIPSELYSPIRQDIVLLKSAEHSEGAKALFEYLRSDAARAIIHSYGYKTE